MATLADIPTGDTRDTGVAPPTYATDPKLQEKYLAQRRMRGVSDLVLGVPDLVNMALNAGIRDVGSLTGLYDPNKAYQFSMPSQNAADLATTLSEATIVPHETMPPDIRQRGANQQALMGMIPVGPEAALSAITALAGARFLKPIMNPTISRITGGRVAGPRPGQPLPGAPSRIQGPIPQVAEAAEDYAKRAGIDLTRQSHYATASPRRGEYIAQAYEQMPHAPEDPAVNAAYEAMARETMGQWEALQRAGTKIDFIKPGMPNPYPGGPTQAIADLRENNHLWVFPTESGFGPEGSVLDVTSSPLLKSTGINVGGHEMLVNDAFRAVHDYFGHGMEGANFGARGEENAWRAHSRLFSPEALPAVTSETRGQNSWVNFGPYGEANRANQPGTIFAEQKTGVMPPWTARESGMPPAYRIRQAGTLAALASALALSRSREEGR
jgi:hypothetical protein